MRITTRQLRHIIREEAASALHEADDAGATGALAVVKDIAELGERLMGAGRQAGGMLHGYRDDPRFPDKLEAATAQIEAQFQALQAAVATLKKEAWKARSKQKIAAAKTAG